MLLSCAFAFPASAGATATIGSALDRAPNAGDDPANGPGATWALTGSQGSQVGPGGVRSPVNGTIQTWRIRAGASVRPVSLRVLRPDPATPAAWIGAGTSPQVVPAPNAINTYSVTMPIAINDYIGIDVVDPANGFYFLDPSFLFSLQWGPDRLPDGGPPQVPSTGLNEETAINAVIEPTSQFEIEGVKHLDKGRLKVRVSLPNPGSLRADERLDPKTGARSAAQRRRLKVKKVTVDRPRTVVFRVRPTRLSREKLAADEDGRIKAKLRLGFTPLFGDSAAVKTRRTSLQD